jgi:DNA-binding beta-propeller fold protein YncE
VSRLLCVLAALAACIALSACGDDGEPSRAATGTAAASTPPGSDAAACPARAPRVAGSAQLSPGVRALAVDPERRTLWAANADTGTVTAVDASTGRVKHRTGGYRSPVALAAGLGGVWVADQDRGSVYRIDPATGRSNLAFELGVPTGMEIVGDLLWVVSLDDGSVWAYQPSSKAVALPDLQLSLRAPTGVTALGTTLWNLGSGDHSVAPLDTRIKRVVEGPTRLDVNSATDIDGGAGYVWVADPKDFSILRVNPITRSVEAFRTPARLKPVGIVVAQCGVWIVDERGYVARFDPKTAKVIGAPVRAARSGAKVVSDGGDGVWVSDPAGGRVVHVQP